MNNKKTNTLEDFKKRFQIEKVNAEKEDCSHEEGDYENRTNELEIEVLERFEMLKDRIQENPDFGHMPNPKLPGGKLHDEFKQLLKDIKKFKEEYDFYDAEGELDMMFPDRHDDDFDEDSMSYDSVFGDD